MKLRSKLVDAERCGSESRVLRQLRQPPRCGGGKIQERLSDDERRGGDEATVAARLMVQTCSDDHLTPGFNQAPGEVCVGLHVSVGPREAERRGGDDAAARR
jgi:hypothetical protein